MALKIGMRLDPYEITTPIGAGGMGEIYQATDTRLDRAVAIKILPDHLADSPERQARFVSPGGGSFPRWSPGGRFGRARQIVETDIEPVSVVDAKGGFYGYRPVPGVGIQKNLSLILNWKPSQGSPASR